ncbi:MAG: hypothetical protein HRT60_10630, partial [Dinoroseobacter sp.]|nr:hypothetical protein [Dinoroseobacter sp.]
MFNAPEAPAPIAINKIAEKPTIGCTATDYGTDPSAWLAAAESDEVDTIWENVGDFVSIFDAIGWEKSEFATGSTIVIRPTQLAEDGDGNKIFSDKRGTHPVEDETQRRARCISTRASRR